MTNPWVSDVLRLVLLAAPWLAAGAAMAHWTVGRDRSTESPVQHAAHVLAAIGSFAALFTIMPWSSCGDAARTSLLLAGFVMVGDRLARLARSWRRGHREGSARRAAGNIAVAGAAFLLVAYVHATARPTRPAVELSFPLDGVWAVGHGGGIRLLNHHVIVAAQRYALDLTKIGRDGRNFEGDPSDLRSHHAWNAALYAPAAGMVATARDDLPDLPVGTMDSRNLAGNHIVLVLADGSRVMLAHLRQGSVVVQPRDTVRTGQFLARVGNSGNTSLPHLHLGVMRRTGTEWIGVGFCFDDVDPAVGCPIRNDRLARLK